MNTKKKVVIGIGIAAALGIVAYGAVAFAAEKPKGGGGTLPAKTTVNPTPDVDDDQPQPTDDEDLTPQEQSLKTWAGQDSSPDFVDTTPQEGEVNRGVHEEEAVPPDQWVEAVKQDAPPGGDSFDITDPSTWIA